MDPPGIPSRSSLRSPAARLQLISVWWPPSSPMPQSQSESGPCRAADWKKQCFSHSTPTVMSSTNTALSLSPLPSSRALRPGRTAGDRDLPSWLPHTSNPATGEHSLVILLLKAQEPCQKKIMALAMQLLIMKKNRSFPSSFSFSKKKKLGLSARSSCYFFQAFCVNRNTHIIFSD